MWVPRWLGEIYTELYFDQGESLFTFDQARKILGTDTGRLQVAFSKLHSVRALTVFSRTRPRAYRLLDPTSFVLLASGNLANAERVKQERYLPLILKTFRETHRRIKLESFAVYGSVARGRARDDSDTDILVISEDLRGSIGNRLEHLMEVEDSVGEELEWLRDQGIRTRPSLYPLRPEEARRVPDLFLDLTQDAVTIYDQERFLETILSGLRARLLEEGAVRRFVDEDRWYWDLKPGYSFGEEIEVP